MSERIIIEQGSNEWHEIRKTRLGASEIAAALGVSQFMPKNMRELVEVKLGYRKVFCSNAMRQGNECEARARELAEAHFNCSFEPQTFMNDNLIASLDGLSFDGDIGIEIKTSTKSLVHIVRQYNMQIMQQLLLSGAKQIYLIAYRVETDTIEISIPFFPDKKAFALIEMTGRDFKTALSEYKPTEIDPMAERYAELAKQKADIEAEMDTIKSDMLIKYTDGYEDSILTIYKIKGRQTIDYKKVIAEKALDIDLTEYIKQGNDSYGIKLKGK